MSTIYYFTNSYPFGLAEEWKRNEIRTLSNHFEKIIVIPYSYGGDKRNKGEVIDNVQYHDPILSSQKNHSLIFKLISILFSSSCLKLISEAISNKVYFRKIDFSHWVITSFNIIQLKKSRELKAYISKMRINDVAYFFWGRGTSEILALSKLKPLTIIRVHNYDIYSERYNSNYLPFQKKQIKNIDYYLTISSHATTYLKSKFPEYQQKIVLNRLGTFTTQSLNIAEKNINPFTFFTCSNLIEIKRVDIIANALANFIDIPINWIHIGDGEDADKIHSIMKTAPNNIHYKITGWLTRAEMEQLYFEHNPALFINVSEMEGVPVSIMEACSHGTPILATNVGGNSEIVSSSNGKLVSENISSEELAKEIVSFSELPSLTKQNLSDGSIEIFQTKYRADVNSLQFVRLILESIKK